MKHIKTIILVYIGLLTSCTEVELPTPVPVIESIFSVNEITVVDGQDIHFNLQVEGLYTLTLVDKESEQVINRERFNGNIGKNIKKIYTNSIQSKILYLLLEDEFKTTLGKTIIII